MLVETGLANVVQPLKALGHQVDIDDKGFGFGGYQAICWDEANRIYCGGSESRFDGQSAGY